MFYLGVGLCLLLAGYSLLSGDSGRLPYGSKIPFYFGEYKDIVGAVFLLAGVALIWVGIKSIQNVDGDGPKGEG